MQSDYKYMGGGWVGMIPVPYIINIRVIKVYSDKLSRLIPNDLLI
jgi:hypothetical protein